jgi:hypothetical protein
MSTLRVNNLQIGQSGTAAQNFTLYQPTTPDGTLRLAVGNSGATTGDVLSVSSTGLSVTGTLSATGNVTLSGGTANGVLYLNGSKVATSGSALTFDGTNFFLNTGYMSFNSNGYIRADSANNKLTFQAGSSGYLWKDNNNSGDWMALTSTGLGIGTSSPNRKLEVNGISRFTDGTTNVEIACGGGVAYIGPQTNSPLAFQTNNTERMRLDSSGNLGLGVTPSAWGSTGAKGLQVGTALALGYTNATGSFIAGNAYYSATGWQRITTGAATAYLLGGDGTHIWYSTSTSSTANSAITFTQAMTLDASGDLQIGTTTSASRAITVGGTKNSIAIANANGGIYFGAGGSGGGGGFGVNAAIARAESANYHISGSAAGDLCIAAEGTKAILFGTSGSASSVSERARITSGGEFYIAGTTDQGAYNLQCNGTGVWGAGAYVNGSDERLKDDIQSLDSCLNVVNALRPVTFKYKPEHSKDQSIQTGFIAQELQQVLAGKPYLEGLVQEGPQHLNVAYQNIIPLLTKAIQEQQALITALTARVAALEGTQP